MLGISFDTPADNKAFVDKNGFTFPLLSDTDKSVAIAYGAAGDATAGYPQRHTAVIGPDGTLERLITDVKAATHAQTLLDSLPPGDSRPARACERNANPRGWVVLRNLIPVSAPSGRGCIVPDVRADFPPPSTRFEIPCGSP